MDNWCRTVGYCVFYGGLDGKVFVDPIGSQPYVFLGTPTEDFDIKMQYVSISRLAGTDRPQKVSLGRHFGDKEYDPSLIESYFPPSQVLDQDFLRQIRLRGVGD